MSEVSDIYYSRDGDFFEDYGSTQWPSRDRATTQYEPDLDGEDDDDE